jgi:CRISPR system Cascade subunit CasB
VNASSDAEHRFVVHLAALAGKSETGEERNDKQKNLAALAALRRGLGKSPGEAAEMFPYVVPYIPDYLPPYRQDDYFLVASLFAAHQVIWRHTGDRREPTNLGASFRWLHAAFESGSIEKRFVALLNAEHSDLPEHLRHGISLLKAHEIPVDWERLLRDLAWWDSERRSVQRAWANAYWRTESPRTQQTDQVSAAPSVG